MAGTLTRIAKTSPATLTHTFVRGEAPTDPTGSAATVAITDANGAVVVASTAATRTGTGVYTYALPGQASLAWYTVAWTATFSGSAVVEVDYAEISEAFFFTLADGRGSDSSLADTAKYPTAQLEIARQEVEDECETICDRAFVPRYRRAVLDGTGGTDIILTDAAWSAAARSAGDIRRIRSVTMAPRYGETAVALTVAQLAACYVTADMSLRRTDNAIWTEGVGNIVIEYEYGKDAPPTDLVRAAYTRLRTRLNIAKSGIPDRATSFSTHEGATYRLDMPGAFKTGIPDVDAVYSRYSRRSGAGTGSSGRPVAASRTLTYDSQRGSLFHGKRN